MLSRRALRKRQTREVLIRTSHPGRGVDIDRIFAIYDKAELGILRDLCDLYDDIAAKDLTLSGLVETRHGALLGCRIILSPGGTSDDDKALAREFAAMLDLWDIDLYALVDHHQYSVLFYGFAATEIIWRQRNGRYDIVELLHPKCRIFRVATEVNRWLDGAAIDELLIQADEYGTTFERLIAGKWLVTRRMGERMLAAHSGMMYQTAPMSAMKMDTTIDWRTFVARFGLPLVVATIASFTDIEAKEAAEQSLATLGTTNGLITAANDRFELSIHDGAKSSRSASSSVHSRFIHYANIEMAKYWTGGYLTSEQGDKAGSYAQASVHGELRGNLLDLDKARICWAIGRLARL
ncbi:MAG: DUF935 family protein, partial [Myxococcota bacterium]